MCDNLKKYDTRLICIESGYFQEGIASTLFHCFSVRNEVKESQSRGLRYGRNSPFITLKIKVVKTIPTRMVHKLLTEILLAGL